VVGVLRTERDGRLDRGRVALSRWGAALWRVGIGYCKCEWTKKCISEGFEDIPVATGLASAEDSKPRYMAVKVFMMKQLAGRDDRNKILYLNFAEISSRNTYSFDHSYT
jgi:hypothetical protein